MNFTDLHELRALCLQLPKGDEEAALVALERQNNLTKPPGSLGRLEELAIWLARYQGCSQGEAQGRELPRLDQVEIIIFAGSHGITRRGVSAYGEEVTAQMVGNFETGGAAINQLAHQAGAHLKIVPLSLDQPTQDFTQGPAMSETEFIEAVRAGFEAVDPQTDLLALGEMGIGNTTIAAALCLALFGGSGADWAGRGTGVDAQGVARKISVIEQGVALHKAGLIDPLFVLQALGGREQAALFGAALAARHHHVPVIIDGFVVAGAMAPWFTLTSQSVDHMVCGHVSAEQAHHKLLKKLGLFPLLDLHMRLGEASGATLAILMVRAALACHKGMSTFEEAGVSPD